MNEAIINSTSVDINSEDDKYSFRTTGQTIKFDGFLKVYPSASKENILPEIKEKESMDLEKLDPTQHFTQPPARYSEATLVKALEEYEIGRPSTYAPTISTILARNYITKEEKRLKPTDIGIVVNDLLVEHFSTVVDYEFTAKMESDLDEIGEGKKEWQPVISEFYFPFHENLELKDKEVTKKELTEEKTDEVCEKCASPMIIKVGRFGKFMACTGYPECKNTKPIEGEGEEQEKIEAKCPECDGELVHKHGRFGKFIACSNYPDCKYIQKSKPETTGVKCNKCGKGEFVARRSKRGQFYGCSNYPECRNALWSKPTGEKCPECEALLILGKNDTVQCSNKECKYTAEHDPVKDTE